jgi:enterochelin esterase-like enzyme
MTSAKFIVFIALLIGTTALVFAQPKAKMGKKPAPELHAEFARETQHGTVVSENLVSTILRDNRVGLDPNRSVKVYLPPGYAQSGKSYPVVYYCHNNSSNPEQLFGDGNLVKLLERSFANGVIQEFIFVSASYNTSTGGSLYENSPTSGRWLDYTVAELVPFIDAKFRTLRHRDSRALSGDFIGGRGALKLAMTHSEVFGVVYALHPVATGTGYLPWATNDVNWKKIHQAKTLAELAGEGRAQMFVAMAQATLPNLNRPPFYCDFWMEMENGEPRLHVENTRKAQDTWLLDRRLERSADKLRKMRGIAFDWARYDPTPTHVYANQAFSRKLEDLGVEHEAEEYRGNPWNKTWTEDGRFYARVLPFFAKHLVFEVSN